MTRKAEIIPVSEPGEIPEEEREWPFYPQSLGEAVAMVMAEVRRLEKNQENTFADYLFASVDDFKDMIRPAMARYGVTIMQDEIACETFDVMKADKSTLYFKYTYAFRLRWKNELSKKERATVALPFALAQTSGQAKSYALKEYIKSAFLASSGDISEDADYEPIEFTNKQIVDLGIWEKLETGIRNCTSVEELNEFTKMNKEVIRALPKGHRALLRTEYSTHKLELKSQEVHDPAGDYEKSAELAEQYEKEQES